jgi:hypothetical protein
MNSLASLLVMLSALQMDFVGGARIESVRAANCVAVTYNDFQNYMDGRLIRRVVRLIGVDSPQRGEPGFEVSLKWAKNRFRKGEVASGNEFEWKHKEFLGDLHVMPHEPGQTHEVSADALASGMGRFNPKLTPKEYREDPIDFAKYQQMMNGIEQKARAAGKGLWGTVWRKSPK